MGHGRYSSSVYAANTATRTAKGLSSFSYNDDHLSRVSRDQWKPHQTLDPDGLSIRESRDSVDHPNSIAVACFFDVTGSMAGIPRTLQKELPALLGSLQSTNGLDDVQILFGGIGDATCDAVPLQCGQFESDNRLDENLENLVLEGGGGGQLTESYELALYLAAKHMSCDCYEKRNEKGFFFMTGDEMAYPKVKKSEVQKILGLGIQEDVKFADILAEAQRKFHVFFILPTRASHGNDPSVIKFWKDAVGPDYFLTMQAEEEIVDVISTAIATTQAATLLSGTTAAPTTPPTP